MNISFDCALCGQHLEVEAAAAGLSVECPSCKGSITVPSQPATFKPKIVTPQAESVTAHKEVKRNSGSIANRCKNCGSADHLIKASAAYEQGTTTVAGSQRLIGGAIYSDGDGGVGIAPAMASGSFQGVQQTTLAQRLSPPPLSPAKKGGHVCMAFGIFFFGLGTILLFIVFSASDTPAEAPAYVYAWYFFWGGAIFVAIAWLLIRASRRDFADRLKIFERDFAHWQKLWYCTKCGSTSYF